MTQCAHTHAHRCTQNINGLFQDYFTNCCEAVLKGESGLSSEGKKSTQLSDVEMKRKRRRMGVELEPAEVGAGYRWSLSADLMSRRSTPAPTLTGDN